MQKVAHEIIVLKPTRRFLSFLVENRPDMQWPELPLFQKDTTAYTLPCHESDDDLLEEVERNYPRMFEHEVSRWLGEEAGQKIKGSFFDFLCFFKFELHTQLIKLQDIA
jgi:hypothetical protein